MDALKAVKFVDGTDDVIEGWAAPFDGPVKGKDFDGEAFSARTDFALNWFETRPVLFHHGFDAETGIAPVGRVTSHELKANGLWAQAQLDRSNAYWEDIAKLVAEGKLFFSSGALSHLVKKNPDGEITRWPWVELSLTPTPANPFATLTATQAAKHFKSAGLDTSDLRALGAEEDEDETTTEEAAADSADTTTTPAAEVAAAELEPAASEVEALEPAIEKVPHVSDQETKPAAEATVATTASTTEDTSIDTHAEIKSMRADLAAFIARMNDEPATKAGGVVIPAAAYVGLKSDVADEVKAFENYIRGGSPRGMKRSEWAAKAALNETTAGQGGYAVPVQYSNDLVVPLTNLSYLRNAGARIINFSGTDAVHVPSLTYTSAAVLTAEAQPYSEVEPTMGEVVFTPYKYTRLAKVSEELASDSRFDLWGQILMPDWAQAYAQTENTAFTTGTGSSQPDGIVHGTSTGVTAATTALPTADEFINTFFALDYKYRANAKWMMNDATIGYVRTLKDGQSRYLWAPGVDGNTQGEFLGKPIVTNNSMATLAASHDVALFGDFSYFWIGQWAGLDVQRLVELYSASGQIGFRSYKRFDAHVMLSAAFTKLTTHS